MITAACRRCGHSTRSAQLAVVGVCARRRRVWAFGIRNGRGGEARLRERASGNRGGHTGHSAQRMAGQPELSTSTQRISGSASPDRAYPLAVRSGILPWARPARSASPAPCRAAGWPAACGPQARARPRPLYTEPAGARSRSGYRSSDPVQSNWA